MSRFVILAIGSFDYIENKTGNMLIRYKSDQVFAVIDPYKEGKTAQQVLGWGGNIPCVKSFMDSTRGARRAAGSQRQRLWTTGQSDYSAGQYPHRQVPVWPVRLPGVDAAVHALRPHFCCKVAGISHPEASAWACVATQEAHTTAFGWAVSHEATHLRCLTVGGLR